MEEFYQHVQKAGQLPTRHHAERWTRSVLATLGFNLDRRTKKKLQQALPEDLAKAVGKVFFLAHFRDNTLTSAAFRKAVARRSGNSDAQFAYYPTIAVFQAVKKLIGADLQQQVANTLSPEVRALWES